MSPIMAVLCSKLTHYTFFIYIFSHDEFYINAVIPFQGRGEERSRGAEELGEGI